MNAQHVIINKAGKLASKGWRGAPGSGFIWAQGNPHAVDTLLVFPTVDGATAFSKMNGGDPVPLATWLESSTCITP